MNSFFNGLPLFQAAPATGGNTFLTIGMFAAVFAIFYFMIIRPQNKKQKAMQKMISEIKKGDKVVTIGGIHGLVHAVKETTVVIKVDDSSRLEFSKSAIASVLAKSEAVETPAVEEKKD
ncbi:MAG: preprotein translocase subunit YajC [Spirochaetes bacterium]|nr:preprotein translocase subunit YajC [Spirochaetota bacterium]MBU0957105.1 preprotein translocase subunit YajC [Spirochaetota bacterium]